MERRDEYTYDEKSNLLEEKQFNPDNILESRGVSKYDKNGNEIEYIEYLNGSIWSKDTYSYDSQGNQKTESYDSDGKLKSTSERKSEFDKYKNKIKELIYRNGELKTIRENEIEYYK